MIIISQNGNRITHNINLSIMPKYDSYNTILGYEILVDNVFSIGEYETEERCQQILECIAENGETQRFFKMPKE